MKLNVDTSVVGGEIRASLAAAVSIGVEEKVGSEAWSKSKQWSGGEIEDENSDELDVSSSSNEVVTGVANSWTECTDCETTLWAEATGHVERVGAWADDPEELGAEVMGYNEWNGCDEEFWAWEDDCTENLGAEAIE